MARKRDSAVPGKVEQIDPTRCAYEANGERCRYPGTMSPVNWNGEGPHPGPWYCRHHWEVDSPMFGAEVVADSASYIAPDKTTARNPLAEQAKRDMIARADREAAEYCAAKGLTRQPGETAKEFGRRNLAAIQGAISDLSRKMRSNPPSGTDWARKILARVAAGERLPSISIQRARAALGHRERQPGEEG